MFAIIAVARATTGEMYWGIRSRKIDIMKSAGMP